jgi:hypothetical protein
MMPFVLLILMWKFLIYLEMSKIKKGRLSCSKITVLSKLAF